jgi:nitroreductase
MLDVPKAIIERRSVRAFTNENVYDENIERLLEAARWAPSADNTQPLQLALVKGMETKRKLSEAALNQTHSKSTGCHCGLRGFSTVKQGLRKPRRTTFQYTGYGSRYRKHSLGCSEAGVGNLLDWGIHEMEVRKAINASKNVKPVVIVSVGYPAMRPVAPERRTFNEIVHYETF